MKLLSIWEIRVLSSRIETRAIRTPEWAFAKRFKGSGSYPLEDELYDLKKDPDERTNLAQLSDHMEVVEELGTRLDSYFGRYADPRFDLWRGGSAKSNSSRPWLWQDAWGGDWKPIT